MGSLILSRRESDEASFVVESLGVSIDPSVDADGLLHASNSMRDKNIMDIVAIDFMRAN